MHKILLVDDVKLLLEIQKKYLATSKLHILTAADGAEALEVAQRERPDLIVMDKYMPKMDGIACCEALRAEPLLRHIPVIMVSNSARPADLEEYTRIGCNDYLAKPIDPKLYLNLIRKYLPSIERRGVRVNCRFEVRLLCNGVVHRGMSEDIGLGGVFVGTGLALTIGEELRLSFVLPGSDAPTEAKGRVAWLNRQGELPPGVGIEFLEITGSGIPLLRRSELQAFVA